MIGAGRACCAVAIPGRRTCTKPCPTTPSARCPPPRIRRCGRAGTRTRSEMPATQRRCRGRTGRQLRRGLLLRPLRRGCPGQGRPVPGRDQVRSGVDSAGGAPRQRRRGLPRPQEGPRGHRVLPPRRNKRSSRDRRGLPTPAACPASTPRRRCPCAGHRAWRTGWARSRSCTHEAQHRRSRPR